MAEEHDEEMQELMEEMAEDLEVTPPQEKNLRQKSWLSALTPQGQLLVYGGIGLLIIIILLFIVFGRGEKFPTDEINATKGRLEKVENKLIQIEGVSQESLRLKKQIQEIENTVSRLDRSLSALREQISKQPQDLDGMQKSSAPVVKKKEAAPQRQNRMHEVVRGDTLFKIAKKYGVSVEELRHLNKFSKTQAIYPGQKIIIP